jgi:DNA-binding NtrC family response regulator
MMNGLRLLFIEADHALGEMLAMYFEDLGADVTVTGNGARGLEAATTHAFDVALLDQHMPDGVGVDLLPRLPAAAPALGVIMMTGQHDLALAIDATGRGAVGFVYKPVRADQLGPTFERVGGTETLASSARIVAATDCDLMAEVASRRFREDPAYRLRVVEICMPPLR